MDFIIASEGKGYNALITNIYSLVHLGIPNSHRMMVYVDGAEVDQVDIVKRVLSLAMGIIKYRGKTDSPHQEAGKPHKYSYHFAFTGQKSYLQTIRDKLGIVGEDEEEEIEDFDDDIMGSTLEQLAALHLAADPKVSGGMHLEDD
jgi:hypothetical protein